MDNPCWGCVPPKRHAECHGSCPRYVKYIADFRYIDHDGKTVVEDTKGVKTPVYILKRKLLLWVHGIRVVEV